MKRLLFILLFLPVLVEGQIISVFAGTGGGYCCDGGPATAAGIPEPVGGVFDNYGNYYFADCLPGHRVRKIDASGIISTVAGTGVGGYNGDNIPATAAQVYEPIGVILDPQGNIYIADVGNNRVRKVDATTGIITTFAGNGTGSFGGDNGPATAAMISGIQDIDFDKRGNLYIADNSNHRVRKVDTSGVITTIAGTGTAGHTGDTGPATAAKIRGTIALTVDDTGNVYIADSACVRKISTLGIINTVVGNYNATYIGDGMPATAAQVSPSRLAFDAFGQLYIGDKYNLRVYKIDSTGIMRTVAGNGGTTFLAGNGGPATAASIYHPTGLAFDACGNLYIAEDANQLIRKVTFDSICSGEPLSINKTIEPPIISIYPNPTNNIIHIDGITSKSQYNILNIIGTIIQQGTLKQGDNSIPIQSLPAGMYMVTVTCSDGQRVVRKIVKE